MDKTQQTIVKVLLARDFLLPLYYFVDSNHAFLNLGRLVLAPLKKAFVLGIIWETNIDCHALDFDSTKIKTVFQLSQIVLDSKKIKFLKLISHYYISSLGSVLKLILPIKLDCIQEFEKNCSSEIKKYVFNLRNLSYEQNLILDQISNFTNFKPILFKGITGSGKTEIYFHLIAENIKKNKQSLVLIPEISLNEDIVSRFTERFGLKPAVWHSKVTKKNKKIFFANIVSGKELVIIGTRSSLFLPYKNLSLIIVDEEHDKSYKQESGISYNARDMVVLLAKIYNNIKLVLVTATPSLESLHNFHIGKYNYVSIKKRFSEVGLPRLQIIDMISSKVRNDFWLSEKLLHSIRENLSKKEQVLLFLNKKGFANFITCESCSFKIMCKYCSTNLVLHKKIQILKCHYCGYRRSIYKRCPNCNGYSLRTFGVGVEQVEEKIRSLFPDYVVKMISKDLTKSQIDEVISQMRENQIDILIATQIISKGFNFPNLTLVGIIDDGLKIYQEDLRINEKIYQLLTQIGGRSGRYSKQGKVLIQSYDPQNKILKFLTNYQEEEFLTYELKNREKFQLPPFTRLVNITFFSKNKDQALELARIFVKNFHNYFSGYHVRILGPVESVIFKISNNYRYRILIIAKKNIQIQKYIKLSLQGINLSYMSRINIDIDPQNLI